MRKTMLAAAGMTLGLALAPAHAQNLQMTDAPAARATGDTPARGMSKGQVERKFGAPSERIAAVGQPPISRWVYPGFIVYFERNLVIHAVATPVAAQP